MNISDKVYFLLHGKVTLTTWERAMLEAMSKLLREGKHPDRKQTLLVEHIFDKKDLKVS